MNTLEELMVITAEECGELTQECMKTIRFRQEDMTKEARDSLLQEASDVYAMIQLMIRYGLFDYYELEVGAKKKHKKLEKWSNIFDGLVEKD